MNENENTQNTENTENKIDEATQTLINEAVKKALDEATKAHKAEEDRRATEAYKKGQKAAKEEAEAEARKAQMSAEEKAAFEKKELEDQIQALQNENALMKNKEKAVNKLMEAKVSVEFADTFLDVDETKTLTNIDNFIKRFNEAVNERVSEKIPSNTPKSSDTSAPAMSLEQFQKMTIQERIELAEKNPTLYDQLDAMRDAKK